MKKKFYIIALAVMTVCFSLAFPFTMGAQAATNGTSLPVTLEIHKVDGGTKLPVSGAVFVLSKEDGYFLATAPAEGNFLWSDNESVAYPMTTDQDGIIVLAGLSPGTYYLQETSAPEGYLLLEEALKLQISAEYGKDAAGRPCITKSSVRINDGEPVYNMESVADCIAITVENTYDTVLPATGGIGTSTYYVLGFVSLFAVSLVVVAKRLLREA